MIPTFTIVCCVITLFVTLILPVLAAALYARKHKGVWSAWLLGAVGFFVPQLLIRLPILQALSGNADFLAFAQAHLVVYGLGLAFTAGLFELAGRLAVAKILQKKLSYPRALAAGMGHGGIESMALIGLTYINNLVYILMIQSGSFDSLIAQTAAAGADVSQLELIQATLLSASGWMFLLAGVERVLTVICHAAMSTLVCYGVYRKKAVPACLLCLGLHTLVDSTVTLTMVLPQKIAYAIIYTVMALIAGGSLWLLQVIRKKWEESI